MNIRLSGFVGNFVWLLENLLARQKGLCCVSLDVLNIALGKDHVFWSFKSVAALWMHSEETVCQKSLWKELGLREVLNRCWGWVTKCYDSQSSPNTIPEQSQHSFSPVATQTQHSPNTVPTHSQRSLNRYSVSRRYTRCCGPALTIRVAITTAVVVNCNPQCNRHTHITQQHWASTTLIVHLPPCFPQR